MLKVIKRVFCKHDYELVEKVGAFSCISGTQTYKRCKKCGKIKKWIYIEYEGMGWK